MLGAYVLSSGYYDAYYNKANFVGNLIKNDFAEAFKEVDLIATPTSPHPRFQNRRKSQQPSADVSFGHVYNGVENLAGIPAISLPSGWNSEKRTKLPLGIQLMSNYRGKTFYSRQERIFWMRSNLFN